MEQAAPVADDTRPAVFRSTDHDQAPRRRQRDLIAIGVLLALGGLAAANRFAFDTWLARFDFYTFFVPWYAHLGQRLRAFDVPGWNPHLFSGTPFAGDPESGWMYLPAMLAFTLLPVLTGFKAMAALHLTLAGLTTYLFGRVMRLGVGGALVAAVAYVAGPLLQWNTYCCLVLNQFAVWMPLLLLGCELALRAATFRARLLPAIAAGFALSQMFAGWVGQGWLLGPMLLAAWLGWRSLLDPARPMDTLHARLTAAIVTGAVAVGFGLTLGAAGILPRLETNAQSNLAGADYAARGAEGVLNPAWSLPHLLAQVIGSGYERRSAALGGAVVVLALLAPFAARRRFAVPFFAGLVLVCAVLTLDTTPLHRLFYLIPRFRELHEHDAWRIYTLVPFAAAMLAGATVAALPNWRGLRRLPLAVLPLGLVAIAALAVLPAAGFVGWPPLLAAAATTAVIAAVVLAPAPSSPPLPSHDSRPTTHDWPSPVVALLVLLVFLQPTGLELTGSWLGWPADPTWQRHWRPDPWVAESLRREIAPTDPGGAGEFLQARLREGEPFRYVGYAGLGAPGDPNPNYMAPRFEPAIQAILVNGRPMFLGLEEIQGYNPLELRRYEEFMTAVNGRPQNYHTAYLLASGTRSPLLDLLNLRYVLVDARLPADRPDVAALYAGRQEVFRTPEVVVLERRPVPPRAWIVHEARRVARGEALPLLVAGTVDPFAVALVEGDPPPLAPAADPAADLARVVATAPDAFAVETRSDATGLLVVSLPFATGWRATIDGEPAPILPTHHLLQGVPLPAGEHTVAFVYDPVSLRIGLPITGLAVLATVIVAADALRRRAARRRTGEGGLVGTGAIAAYNPSASAPAAGLSPAPAAPPRRPRDR